MDKVLLIICDGLSDRPITELGGKTPLEAAKTPNLDRLVKRGLTGLMHVVDIGIRPGSDVAHLSLFGYDPNLYYSGRGPFEAVGIGMEIKPNDVALRGNFATVDSAFRIIDRRAGRIEHTFPLTRALNDMLIEDTKVYVSVGTGHRAAVILRGKNLNGRISDVDPHKEGVKVRSAYALVKTASAKKTAKIINQFVRRSYQILSAHPLNKKREKEGKLPGNIILLRGAGILPKLPTFLEKYSLKAACIAGGGLYKGIGRLLGMDTIEVPQATGKPDTNIKAKIEAALKTFKTHDFVFVHIKGADVLAEDGDFLGKKKFIEKIDAALSPLVKREDILIVITADHTTSSILKIHTADPVPLLMAGKNLHTDQVTLFGERSVASGKLGHIVGKHLMPIILDFLGRAPLMGA